MGNRRLLFDSAVKHPSEAWQKYEVGEKDSTILMARTIAHAKEGEGGAENKGTNQSRETQQRQKGKMCILNVIAGRPS